MSKKILTKKEVSLEPAQIGALSVWVFLCLQSTAHPRPAPRRAQDRQDNLASSTENPVQTRKI